MSRWPSGDDRGGDPQCGHFTVRLVRGGADVPAMIALEDGAWQATINGRPYPSSPDPVLAEQLYRVWHGGVRISAEEYAYLEALRSWAARCDPSHPLLHPYQPVNISALAPLVP